MILADNKFVQNIVFETAEEDEESFSWRNQKLYYFECDLYMYDYNIWIIKNRLNI